MTELKPCPFCGGKDLEVYASDYFEGYFVNCIDCNAHGAIAFLSTYNDVDYPPKATDKEIEACKEKAKELWNRRHYE